MKKYILITGSNSGIGLAATKALLEDGYHVFAAARKAEVHEELKNKYKNLHPLKIDVTNDEQIAQAFTEIKNILKPDDTFHLINNAGMTMLGPVESLTRSQWQYQFNVNLFGVMELIRKFLPLIRANDGRIINIGSTSGFVAWPFSAAYAASKFALEGACDSLRVELRPFEIPVILIDPGAVKTPIWEKVSSGTQQEMSWELIPYYKSRMDNALQISNASLERNGIEPIEVYKIIKQALTTKKPKARYLVGPSAKVQYLMQYILPTRLFDWLKYYIPEKKNKKNMDYSGEKYLIAQEMGEPVDMIFCRHHTKSLSNEWFLRSHAISDGLSSLKVLLDREQNLQIKSAPQAKKYKKPGFIKKMALLRMHLKRISSIAHPWRHHDKTKNGNPANLCFAYYSQEESRSILKYCKENKMTITSLILWALDKATNDILLEDCPTRAWVLPVNVREDEQQVNEDKNITSSITMLVKTEDTPQSIHNQLFTLYKDGYHWASWIVSNLSKYLSRKKIKSILKKSKPSWAGVYSNVGNFTQEHFEGTMPEDIIWLPAPPVTTLLPVTASSMSWNEHLFLTLQTHPSIYQDENEVRQVLEKTMSYINEMTSLNTSPCLQTCQFSDIIAHHKRF